MTTGEIVDNILKNTPMLEITRYIVFYNGSENVTVPVDFLKALLAEEHTAWSSNMTRQGN